MMMPEYKKMEIKVPAIKNQVTGRLPNLNRTKRCKTCHGDGKMRLWPNHGQPLYRDGRGGYTRYDRVTKQMKAVQQVTVSCVCMN
jgi:hypothetical protein